MNLQENIRRILREELNENVLVNESNLPKELRHILRRWGLDYDTMRHVHEIVYEAFDHMNGCNYKETGFESFLEDVSEDSAVCYSNYVFSDDDNQKLVRPFQDFVKNYIKTKLKKTIHNEYINDLEDCEEDDRWKKKFSVKN
jgi:hypothetical protein